MTVKMTDLTKQQNDALGVFVKDWANLKDSTLKAAQSYKRCIDLGMNMREYVTSRALHDKLLLVAGGKLLPMAQAELLFLSAPATEALATFPRTEQEKVMKEGVEVWRGDKTVRVAFANLSSSDLRRAIDTTGGRGRIVTPEEQAERAVPLPARHDQIIEVRLDFAEAKDVFAAAHTEGKSPASLIKSLLREKGYIR